MFRKTSVQVLGDKLRRLTESQNSFDLKLMEEPLPCRLLQDCFPELPLYNVYQWPWPGTLMLQN